MALIAGASRGLGLLLAREFARNGCQVVICARDAEELERDDLEHRGGEVIAETCDVTDARFPAWSTWRARVSAASTSCATSPEPYRLAPSRA